MKISADKPISSIDEDVLGRASFAKELARGIVNLPVKDGFVIGLSGKWGSGKTSTISMITEWIEHHEIEILNSQRKYLDNDLKVWNKAELRPLAKLYRERFTYLDTAYEDEKNSANKTARWHLLKLIKTTNENDKTAYLDEEILRYFFLKHHVRDKPETIIFRFSPWLIPKKANLASAFIADLYLVMQRHLGLKTSEQARAYVEQLFTLIGASGEIIGDSRVKKISDALSDITVGISKARTKTLDELKNKLEQQLRELGNRRLLIIIDDLDRMTPKESTQMIGLVKNLGDLPNIIYLLSYDINVVAEHIDNVLKLNSPEKGQKYLQKIVQLNFELDQPQKHELFNVFSSALLHQSKQFSGSPKKQFYDIIAESLPDAWKNTISLYVGTPRDVTRLVNKFIFVWSVLFEQTDPLDLIVLCIADVFDAELYRWIMTNQYQLNYGVFNILEVDLSNIDLPTKSNDLSPLEKIIHRTGQNLELTQERKNLLQFLFPNKSGENRSLYTKYEKPHHAIENRDHTSNYFRLSTPNINWPRTLLEKFKSSTNYNANFEEILNYIKNSPDNAKSELRVRIITEIEDWLKKSNDDFNEILRSILKFAPTFIRAKDEKGWTDNLDRLSEIIYDNVRRPRTSDNRDEFHNILFEGQYDFTLPSRLIRKLFDGRKKESQKNHSDAFDSNPSKYLNSLVKRCERMMTNKELFEQAAPERIIHAWSWSLDEDDLDESLFEPYLKEFKYAKIFFKIDYARSTSGNYISHKNPTIDHKKIKELAEKILNSKQSNRDLKILAQEYLMEYKRGYEKFNRES